MLSRDQVVRYFNRLLQPEHFKDSTFNGLQVEGADKISRVAFAVDSSLSNFREAASRKCGMLVVHHGAIWGGLKKITGHERERIACLLENGINLYVSHLPLDRHTVLGNNAMIMKLLGAKKTGEVGEAGVICELRGGLTPEKFLEKVKVILGKQVRSLDFGKDQVKKIAVCSGAVRHSFLTEALEAGARTVLTGEGMGESMFADIARENGMNVVFAGHTESEVPGMKALMHQFRKDLGKKTDCVWIGNG